MAVYKTGGDCKAEGLCNTPPSTTAVSSGNQRPRQERASALNLRIQLLPHVRQTYCDLLKRTRNKGKAHLGSSVVSGGDGKQHSLLSAVLGLEGRAGHVSNHPPLNHFQQPVPLSCDIALKELQGQERQSYRLFLTVPLVFFKMHWVLPSPTLPAAPCRASTAQDPHHRTRTDERCQHLYPSCSLRTKHVPTHSLAWASRNSHG